MSQLRVPTHDAHDIVRRHGNGINRLMKDTAGLASNSTTLSSDRDFSVTGSVDVTGYYKVLTVQVVGPRQTGWAADTGTAKKTTQATYAAGAGLTYSAAYVQAELTATGTRIAAMEAALQNASQTIKALKDALILHGLIGT